MEDKKMLKEEELEKVVGGVSVSPMDANNCYTIVLNPGEPAQAAIDACGQLGWDRDNLLSGAENYLNDPGRINTTRTMRVKINITTEWNGAPMPAMRVIITDVQYV